MWNFPPRYFVIGFGAAGVLVLAALFYFTSFDLRAPEETVRPQELPAIAPGMGAPEALREPVRLVAPYQGEAITLLNPDPAVVAQLPEARFQKFEEDLSELARRVSENPLRVEDWLSIGFIKKFFNNYAGTRDAWEYAKLVSPEDARVRYNLGTLYGSYLNQPGLAEQNLKEAIRLDSLQAGYQTALADLHRYAEPPKLALAVGVIQGAIQKLPGDPSLHTYLAELYVAQGENAKAIAEYEKALSLLGSSDAALKSAIESALARLRQ